MLEIRLYGDPVLRRRAEAIEGIDDEVRALAEEMTRTMFGASGVGLAGPQVGVLRRIVVLLPLQDFDDRDVEPLVLVNPEIERASKEQSTLEEGCLSLPGIQENVERPKEIVFRYTDLDGQSRVLKADGLAAHIVQHEIDHLEGLLLIDRISSVRRTLLRKKLSEIRDRARAS